MANKTATFAAGLAEDLSAQHLLLLEWSLGACARLCVASPEAGLSVPGDGGPEGAGEALVSSDDGAVGEEVRSVIHKALAAKLLALENASDLQEEAVALCVSVGAPSAPAAGAAQGDAADEQGPGAQAAPAAQAAAQTSRTAGEVFPGTRAHTALMLMQARHSLPCRPAPCFAWRDAPARQRRRRASAVLLALCHDEPRRVLAVPAERGDGGLLGVAPVRSPRWQGSGSA